MTWSFNPKEPRTHWVSKNIMNLTVRPFLLAIRPDGNGLISADLMSKVYP
jgi:hypothetical protein